jgi:hypothetical protein
MPTNPWPAIDAATPLRSHAAELRQAWEDFIGDGRAPEVGSHIEVSWEPSDAVGVHLFEDRIAPIPSGADESSERCEVHPPSRAVAQVSSLRPA